MKHYEYRLILIAAITCSLLSLNACKKKQAPPAIPPAPVETASAIQKDVPLFIDVFGTLSAPNNVDIVSQVSGKLLSVHFKEGDDVKIGDLLFTIDPAPYQAAFDQAKAALEQHTADLKLKEDNLNRNIKLHENKLISDQDFDNLQTEVTAAKAQIKLDKAAIQQEQINLDYCQITSPINGVTGKRQVDPGNVVSGSAGSTLVNIKMIDPLYVDFSVSETHLEAIRDAMQKEALHVNITSEVHTNIVHDGTLVFIDNTVDDITGTLFLRAEVDNKQRALWPGQFVNVELILGMATNAILVPNSAVLMGKDGPYVFVIKSDSTADLRIIQKGQQEGNLVIIEDGIKRDEQVVTLGQMGLYPGAKVSISQPKGNTSINDSKQTK